MRAGCERFSIGSSPRAKIEKASDLIVASAALLGAVASGELTLAEASAMSATIGNVARAIEVASNAARLTALEEAMADKNGGPR
jgi:hypothetical protein